MHHRINRNIKSLTVADHARRLRLESHQFLDRIGRLPLRANLEPLAENHKGNEVRRRLEIEIGNFHSALTDKRARRKNIRRVVVRAVEKRGRRADRDQAVHTERLHLERRPHALVESRANNKLHGKREKKRKYADIRRERLFPGEPREKVEEHEIEHRETQNETEEKLIEIRGNFFLAFLSLEFRVFRINFLRAISGLFHRRYKRLRFRSLPFHENGRFLGGEVHVRLFDTRNFFERTFDKQSARRTVHAGERQLHAPRSFVGNGGTRNRLLIILLLLHLGGRKSRSAFAVFSVLRVRAKNTEDAVQMTRVLQHLDEFGYFLVALRDEEVRGTVGGNFTVEHGFFSLARFEFPLRLDACFKLHTEGSRRRSLFFQHGKRGRFG